LYEEDQTTEWEASIVNKRRAEIVHDHSYREGLTKQFIKLPIHEAFPAQKLYIKAITSGLTTAFKELKLFVCGYERIHETIRYSIYDHDLKIDRDMTPAEIRGSKKEKGLRTYLLKE
jgi:hypothetical protein